MLSNSPKDKTANLSSPKTSQCFHNFIISCSLNKYYQKPKYENYKLFCPKYDSGSLPQGLLPHIRVVLFVECGRGCSLKVIQVFFSMIK